MAFIVRGTKRNTPPKRRRSGLAPVDEGRRRGMPTNPFTTSMIDVLGCGFAAVFFLFLLFSSSERFHGGAANSYGSSALADLSGLSNVQPSLILRVPAAFARRLDIPEAIRFDGEHDVLFEIADARTYNRGVVVRLLDRSKALSDVLSEALVEAFAKGLKGRLLQHDQFSSANADGRSRLVVFADAFEAALPQFRSEGALRRQALSKAFESALEKTFAEFPEEADQILQAIIEVLSEEYPGVPLDVQEYSEAFNQAIDAIDQDLPRAQTYSKAFAEAFSKALLVGLFVEYGDSVQLVSLRDLGEKSDALKDGVIFSVRVSGNPKLTFSQDLNVLRLQPDPPVPISPLAPESAVYGGGYHVVPAPVLDTPTVRDVPVREETRRIAIDYWHAGRMFSAKLIRCEIVPNSSPTAITTQWRFREDGLSVICDPETYESAIPPK